MHALGGKQVLHAERNAFQCARFTLGNTLIRSFGHRTRLIVSYFHIGVDGFIRGIDSGKIGVGEFGRGDGFGLQLVARLGNGQCGQFAHRQILSVRLNETLFKKGAVFGIRIVQNHTAARKT